MSAARDEPRGRRADRARADAGQPESFRLCHPVHRHVYRAAGYPDCLSLLRDIGGGLSAGDDETVWVQTSYLIAEIIIIPLSGWLASVLSTRWLFAASACGFTLMSLLCGWAWNIQSMIAFRALQGWRAAR